MTVETRPVNLATCTKGDPNCTEIVACVPVVSVPCSTFPVPARLRATVVSSCACLNGTYDLYNCPPGSPAWTTPNPVNVGHGCSPAAEGAAPTACGTDLGIALFCVNS